MSQRPTGRYGAEYLIATGAVLAGLGVAAGAFGTHLLRERFIGDEIDVWRAASNYQMYHALALIAAARLLARQPTRLLRISCGLFIAGIVLFSGSLYLMVLSGSTAFGLFTPIGGTAFLAAWACLAIGVVRANRF